MKDEHRQIHTRFVRIMQAESNSSIKSSPNVSEIFKSPDFMKLNQV
jgi:hypothetical protein